ncbi:frataxin-like protein [Wolffia australiana]
MGLFIRRADLLRRLTNFSSSSIIRVASNSTADSQKYHFSLISPQFQSTNCSRFCQSLPRFFSSSSSSQETAGPSVVDYQSILEEDEFHRLADDTIHGLQEKFEEFGDSIQVDGFDVDYGNQVLTLKIGSLGTYVINKQTPNRQIWLSSPLSGPSRFDWDGTKQCWLYRRTKAELLHLLQDELAKLCGKPINLS